MFLLLRRAYSYLRNLCNGLLCFAMASLAVGQTFSVTPPNYPGMSVPYPYLYVDASSHWSEMAPQGTLDLPTVLRHG